MRTNAILPPARIAAAVLAVAITASIGCAPEKKTDYQHYLACMPRSVIVLPPLNESTQVRAPDAFLATITVPLAERGYYVFPIALVDGMLRENGAPTPGEMHQVPPQKFRDVFDADAVLYITIKKWTNQYIVFDSTTTVRLVYRLVDTSSGEVLWTREQMTADSSNQGGTGDPILAAIAAAVHAAADADGHRERALASQANGLVVTDPHHGMLLGSRHPDFAKDQKLHADQAAKMAAAPSSGG